MSDVCISVEKAEKHSFFISAYLDIRPDPGTNRASLEVDLRGGVWLGAVRGNSRGNPAKSISGQMGIRASLLSGASCGRDLIGDRQWGL